MPNQPTHKNAALMQAVANLIKVKGRYHTEQAYKQLVEAYDAALASPAPQAEEADLLRQNEELRKVLQRTKPYVDAAALSSAKLELLEQIDATMKEPTK